MKILIVGAGVAGLAVGWRLAAAGIPVEILERGLAGRGATWASAGMIAAGAEHKSENTPAAQFAREARAKWPGFTQSLEAASAIRIDYRETSSLLVAESPQRARALESRANALARDGAAAGWVGTAELRRREPLLSPDLLGALHITGDAQVDNRALPDALSAALTSAGGVLREHCDVRALAIQNGRVLGVVTREGMIASDMIILACGAWVNLIGGIGPDDLPPVKPAKGQMAAMEAPAETALPQALIWADDVYLVPRGRRLFVGATVEDASFDTSVSSDARDNLLAAAVRIIPSLGQWRLAEMWAGLRPRTPDDAPVLGATQVAGLFVAGGQFRNGILFAPAVADAICALILGQPARAEHRAFDPPDSPFRDRMALWGETMAFVLHPRLMADTAGIADWSLSRVLLMNDKRFPWIVLVPRRPELGELFDLDESARGVLTGEITRVGEHLKGWAKSRGGCDRINVGMIGNMVPQLHVHVVARVRGDPAWPGTVWGAGQAIHYGAAELSRVVTELRDIL